MRKKNWALGALIAAAGGYLAGILTAPKSGKETRKDIHDTAIKSKAEGERILKQRHSELNSLIETSTKKAKTIKQGAQKELVDAIDRAQAAKSKAGEILSILHENGDVKDKDLQKAIDESKKAKEHLQKFMKKEHKKTGPQSASHPKKGKTTS